MPLTARPPRAAPRTTPRGFTLVELLVAAALGLVVASAVSLLLVSQLRAFARTQGATAVQRDLRLGLALLPMDLRGASRADTDLVALTSTAAELRATIASSVICDVVGSGATKTLVLPPTNLPAAMLTAWFAAPVAGDTVKVLIRPTAGGDRDQWLTGVVAGPSPLPWSPWTTTTPGGLCAGAGVGGVSPPLALPVTWSPGVNPDSLAFVKSGMPVRVLRRVKYELYAAGTGRWFLGYSERTGGVWSTREPVAGPYAATPTPGAGAGAGAGVSFAYFDTSGVAIAAPVSTANLTRVGRIDVTLRPRTQVRAGAGRDSVVVRDSALVRVALRNRV